MRLIAPIYVKPFVKRQKNDAADAEAIAEAASRPTMRFVAVKTEEQQARAMLFRTRDLLVRQRTQLINALRGHLAEYGFVAPQGPAHLKRLADAIADETLAAAAPCAPRSAPISSRSRCSVRRSRELDKRLRAAAGQAETTRRLQTMPGVGPITALAVETFAPPMESSNGAATSRPGLGSCRARLDRRQAAARQDLEDGPARHPPPADHRRDGRGRWAARVGAAAGSWLARMLAKKPRMLVAIALANKMARGIWAMLTQAGELQGSGGSSA